MVPLRQGSIAGCGSRRARKEAQLEAELDELDGQAGSASVLNRLLSHSWAERGNQTMCAPSRSQRAGAEDSVCGAAAHGDG